MTIYTRAGLSWRKSERAKIFAKLLAQGALKPNVELLLPVREAEAIKLFSNTYSRCGSHF